MYDWNDLRIFLTVAEAGSALAASRKLGINQSTVNRRLRALEHSLGIQLFDRQNRGHELSVNGRALLDTVRRVETAANDVEFAAKRLRRVVSGVVRITAPEALAELVINPMIFAFQERYPEVRVDQVASDARLDIVHGEADVAFRAGSHPDDPRLIARRLPDSVWAAYCSETYAAARGLPVNAAALKGHNVIAYTGGMAALPCQVWLSGVCRDGFHGTSNTSPNMRSLLQSGLGVGVLPRFLGDACEGLVHCFDCPPGTASELWLLTSREARASPQVRAFIDFVVPLIEARKAQFGGCG